MNSFFSNTGLLDHMVLRPLAHVRGNWEVTWDDESQSYKEEPDSFAGLLNNLIAELAITNPPSRYHDSEDRLAEYVQKNLNWGVHKVGMRWVGADYDSILEQGSFGDVDQGELLLAAAGRIRAAQDRGQSHFDDMEESHQRMLSAVLSIILWQRDAWE
jgi:hypothetical protein